MKKFSLKALGAAILTLGLVVSGAALPANAAALISPSATATGAVTTGAVTVPLTISATTATAGVKSFRITLPTGWTTSMVGSQFCTGATVSGINNTGSGCAVSGSQITIYQSGAALGANTAISVTFVANKFTATAARDFTLETLDLAQSVLDTGIATLASGASSYSVTFNSNGGSGAMADQSASAATDLSANAFTRSGYTFAGWNTAADGSGTSYADGASFPFSANATLYAQWTATLATTGFDAAPYLYGGLALALTGGALMLIARRKHSN